MTVKYGFGKSIPLDLKRAISVVTEILKVKGFGVLIGIALQATLKIKLDEDVPPYRILDACNPRLAHNELATEPSIGL